ncbi:hypothetical protein K3495_g12153, partial [Podosphaera aphanis]
MNESAFDPCLLWCHKLNSFGIVGLQTDDTLFLANESFASDEELHLNKAKFLAKSRETLTAQNPLKFNGCSISFTLSGSTVTLSQEQQCKPLILVTETNSRSTSSRGAIRTGLSIKEQYIAQRARGAYIASMCQPEASFGVSSAAQITSPREEDVAALNKRLKWQIDNKQRGLNFIKLDIKTLRLYAFTDASFANNQD